LPAVPKLGLAQAKRTLAFLNLPPRWQPCLREGKAEKRKR
jgi:hypothetical protein